MSMASSLAIEQLTVECHVPAADEERRARGILDRVLSSVQHELPAYLDRLLAAEGDSDAIIVIDTLRFDATINAAWPRDRIARVLAAQLSRSLWRALERPDAIRFADRPEMVARFLVDLAQGAAYARDWHRAFDGLRVLPASAIVRTLITDEPLESRTALSRLLPADLDRVLALLSRGDAERALTALLRAASSDVACDPAVIVAAALSQRCLSLDTPQQQLALAIAIARQPDAEANDGALAIARALFRLAATGGAASAAGTDQFQTLLRRLAAEGDAGALALVQSGRARFGAEAVEAAVKALQGEQPQAEVRELHTTCGGAWLLLPWILNAVDDHPALALHVLAASAGARAAEVWHSAPLREALDLDDERLAHAARATRALGDIAPVPASASREIEEQNRAHIRLGLAPLDLPRGAARVVGRLAAQAMTAYARRLPGFAESSFRYLWDNLLATEAAIRFNAEAIEVALKAPPLDVIWKITGADRASCALPGGRAVRIAVRR
jgi:hypothetical protein